MADLDGVDVAPDWLTITTDSWSKTEHLRRVAERYIYQEGTVRPWRYLTYQGRQRHDRRGKGGLAFGTRDAGQQGVMQAWGELSREVGQVMMTADTKVTRCDLAVTVLHDSPQPPVVDMMAELMALDGHYSAVVPFSAAGGTLYVGSRASEMFGRLYDKGSQMGLNIPERLLWRYEVEYKRQCAMSAAKGVFLHSKDTAERTDFILRNVENFFRSHGVPVPFVGCAEMPGSIVRYATRTVDNDKTLKWLTEQVRPAVLRLFHSGYADNVIEALGVGVVDGVPDFEAVELVPTEQMTMWPGVDNGYHL